MQTMKSQQQYLIQKLLTGYERVEVLYTIFPHREYGLIKWRLL